MPQVDSLTPMFDRVAVDFVRFVLQSQPDDAKFIALYDALHQAAMLRQFRGLGLRELARAGVSFSLSNTAQLEALLDNARVELAEEG